MPADQFRILFAPSTGADCHHWLPSRPRGHAGLAVPPMNALWVSGRAAVLNGWTRE
jgi:hypothetical protein